MKTRSWLAIAVVVSLAAVLLAPGMAFAETPDYADDIPESQAFPSSNFNASVYFYGGVDPADVFAVYLSAGQRINIQANWTAGRDFWAYLCVPGSTSYSSASYVGTIDGTSGGGSITYDVETSGTYYFVVRGWDSQNAELPYSCSYSITTAPTTSMALVHTPTNPAYGSAAKLTALLRYGTTPLANKRVYFQRWTGSKWVNISSTSYDDTDSYGKAYYNVIPYNNSKTIYRAMFLSSGGYSSASALRGVLPKVYLSTPAAPSSMTRGKTYSISGYLKPKHAAGTYPVRIYKYRYESGTWVYRGYHSARASDYGSYSKYTGSVYLQYSGKWMLKAYAPTDTWHWATWSGYDLVTVP